MGCGGYCYILSLSYSDKVERPSGRINGEATVVDDATMRDAHAFTPMGQKRPQLPLQQKAPRRRKAHGQQPTPRELQCRARCPCRAG